MSRGGIVDDDMTKKSMIVTDAEPYAVLRQQLDDIVLKLQDPDCDVDEATKLYEQALTVAQRLESHLEQAENRISKIQADFGSKPQSSIAPVED